MGEPLADAMHRGLRHMVRRGLRGVWLRGVLPTGPFVWAANHHSWWDPFVTDAVLRHYHRKGCLLMLSHNLHRYGFARRLGAFGTDHPRQGVTFLAAGRTLVIYPEGELRPAGTLAPLARGAAWYAVTARVPLYAVATRVVLRGHQAAEAYLSITEVCRSATGAQLTQQLSADLARELADVDNLMAAADPRLPLPGFRTVLRGRRSVEECIDSLARRWPWVR